MGERNEIFTTTFLCVCVCCFFVSPTGGVVSLRVNISFAFDDDEWSLNYFGGKTSPQIPSFGVHE
jgi:hypothetical protein